MFERFTEDARSAVVCANDEARMLNHDYVGTEHILLGLLREEEGLAARILGSIGVTLEEVRADVIRVIGVGDDGVGSDDSVRFTSRAKRALDVALRESHDLGAELVGTEHLLLGLIDDDECVAARILLQYRADPESVRDALHCA
jgi:ATP-dependent Clp protease ATP-binding subunit ClpC